MPVDSDAMQRRAGVQNGIRLENIVVVVLERVTLGSSLVATPPDVWNTSVRSGPGVITVLVYSLFWLFIFVFNHSCRTLRAWQSCNKRLVHLCGFSHMDLGVPPCFRPLISSLNTIALPRCARAQGAKSESCVERTAESDL